MNQVSGILALLVVPIATGLPASALVVEAGSGESSCRDLLIHNPHDPNFGPCGQAPPRPEPSQAV